MHRANQKHRLSNELAWFVLMDSGLLIYFENIFVCLWSLSRRHTWRFYTPIAAIGEKNRQLCPHQSVAKIACDFRWWWNSPRSAYKIARCVAGFRSTENMTLFHLCYLAIIESRSTFRETTNYPGTRLVRVAFNETFTVVCSRSPQNLEFSHLLFCRGRQRAKKCTKIQNAHTEWLFRLIIPIVLRRCRCHRDSVSDPGIQEYLSTRAWLV